MSSIIKSEYIFFENKRKIEKVESNKVNISKEELYNIYNQRELIIKGASVEALKIANIAKQNAKSDIENYKKRGYEEGYNAGFEVGKNKGYDEGKHKISEVLHEGNEIKVKEIYNMLELIEKQKQNIISKFENEIGIISLDIAEKIIRQKIELNDNVISKIIEHVIKDFKNVEWVKIYISDKEEVEKIEADKSLIDELQKISNDVKIEVGKDLDKGSCIVETPAGIVDASIDTQLNNLKEILLNK